MKTLAVVAALVALPWSWFSWDAHRAERRLEPVVSSIAGRQVDVECQGVLGSLLDAQARHGEVWFGPDGKPEPRIFLIRSTCQRLQAFAGRRAHAELECLRRLDWRAPLPLDPRSDCYRRSSPTLYALLVLAHEAYHTAGVENEARANCYAVQAMAYAALELGAAARDAAVAARAMATLLPLQAGVYATTDCRPATVLDLHPETAAFPTELPIGPP